MITTHVLDTTRGLPAAGVEVRLESVHGGQWHEVGRGHTDANGRLTTTEGHTKPGFYRLTFETGSWFRGQGMRAFHPSVMVVFEVVESDAHIHVPILLSPFGYTTYRGS